MKVLLKFVILCAWTLFVAALWQSGKDRPTSAMAWSLPSPGLLSISRKMTEGRAALPKPTDPSSLAWPSPELLMVLPVTGR